MSPATRAPSKRTVPVQPRGEQDGLPVERVAEIQRARMLTAIVEVAAEHGVGNVTVAQIVACSGVSRRTFYEIFKDCEACLLAALDDAIEQASKRVIPAYQCEGKWHERIRAALTAMLEQFDEQPEMARFLVVDSLGTGPSALERRRYVLARLIGAVDEGRKEADISPDSPPLTAEGTVGAVLSVIHARLLDPTGEDLRELANPLMSMIVLPYLGRKAARRELTLPTPHREVTARRAPSDPLRALDMRLTYRTVRVLMAVASEPGCSNRQVAAAAGITDQGQISKLLARLQRLELVCNAGAEPGRGAPNAWVLTSAGREVQALLAQQSTA